MARGYRGESGYECSTSSSWLTGLMSLAGGVGIGAGLLYLLDPDQGQRRRERIVSGARHLGSDIAGRASEMLTSAGDYASESARGASKSARRFAGRRADEASGMIGGALGSVRDFVSDKLGGVSDYASERYEDTKGYLQDRFGRETRAEHRLGVTICALSSMALGAAMMYVFDPTMGRSRRQFAKERAGEFASQAGEYATQAGQYVKDQASTAASRAGDMASRAGEAVKSGYEQAKDKVTGAASGTASGSGASCPPGMMPASQADTSVKSGTRTTF